MKRSIAIELRPYASLGMARSLRPKDAEHEDAGNGTLTWPHFGTLKWPHPVRRAADCSSFMWLEREAADRDGITSGDVRADKKRSRPRGPVDQGFGSAPWSSPSRCQGSARVAGAVAAQAA